MRNIRAKMREENGVALIMTMILLVVVGVLAAAFLTTSQGTTTVAFRQLDQKRAFWAAEAGVEHVKSMNYVSGEVNVDDDTIKLGDLYESGEEYRVIEVRQDDNSIIEEVKYDESKDEITIDDNQVNINERITFVVEGRYNDAIETIAIDLVPSGGGGGFIGVTEDNEVHNFGMEDIPDFGESSLGPVKHGDNEHDGELTGITWNSVNNELVLSGERFGSGGGHGRFNLYGTNLDDLNWRGEDVKTSSHLSDVYSEGDKNYAVTHQGTLYRKDNSGEWEEAVRHNSWAGSNPDNQKDKTIEYSEHHQTLVMYDEGGKLYYYNQENNDKGTPPEVGDNLHYLAYGDSGFVALDGGEIYSSSNGRQWGGPQTQAHDDFKSVTWTGDKFIAVGDDCNHNIIFTSEDGNSWTEITRGRPEGEDMDDHPIEHSEGEELESRSYDNIAAAGDVVIASSSEDASMLVSEDGGNSWIQYDSDVLEFKHLVAIGDSDNGEITFETDNWRQASD